MKIVDVDKFFEYGVGVGMFMVSVALLVLVFRYFTKSSEKISENFAKNFNAMDIRHGHERAMWQEAEDRRQKATNDVVLRIDTTIRECLMNSQHDNTRPYSTDLNQQEGKV